MAKILLPVDGIIILLSAKIGFDCISPFIWSNWYFHANSRFSILSKFISLRFEKRLEEWLPWLLCHFSKLFLCNKFMQFVNKAKPNTFPHTKGEHPRLIIPFYDSSEKVFAFQGRAFGKEQPKYLTVKLDENKQKVYGLDRVNLQKDIYIVEGPIDSLFIDNCLAAAGADLTLRVSPDTVTYIFDNEPRNKEIIKRMYDVIENDYNIVIWPEHIHAKDVNEMIMNGMTKIELQTIISSNTYSKLEALTKLSFYKKC